jgi:tetratricopeptide (TPR) repeat protein
MTWGAETGAPVPRRVLSFRSPVCSNLDRMTSEPAPRTDRIRVLTAALTALEANHFDIVTTLCEPLLAYDAGDVEARLLCGLAAGARGDANEAALCLNSAATARGNAEHPIRDLTAVLRRIGKPEWIEPQFRAALLLAPDDADLLHAYADFLYDAGRAEEAVPPLRAALHLRPDAMPAKNLLALALAAAGNTDAAIDELRAALALDPSRAGSWANLGLLLKDDGRFDEALAAYDRALALSPHDAQIRVNRVVALLRAGRWAEAWPDYEWRLRLSGHATPRPCLMPSVATLANLNGRAILAVHEDGFGDTLHFARYLPMLAALGAHVAVAVPVSLMRLMRTVPGVIAVHDLAAPPPRFDFYCPFFSLPRAFATTPDTIPAPIPYVHVDPILTARWHSQLPAGAPRIGLVWAGKARPELPGFAILDGRRSMRLAALAPLARAAPDADFVSLQHGPEAAQARTPPAGMRLADPMPMVTDFADTAAIIANLDLVISVDTSVVHLAGAMGKPVFMLDRYDHCWRWLSGRADSPWYPAMRIFRQQRAGDWAQVLCEAGAALAQFARNLRGGTAGHAIGVDLLKVPETVERDA